VREVSEPWFVTESGLYAKVDRTLSIFTSVPFFTFVISYPITFCFYLFIYFFSVDENKSHLQLTCSESHRDVWLVVGTNSDFETNVVCDIVP